VSRRCSSTTQMGRIALGGDTFVCDRGAPDRNRTCTLRLRCLADEHGRQTSPRSHFLAWRFGAGFLSACHAFLTGSRTTRRAKASFRLAPECGLAVYVDGVDPEANVIRLRPTVGKTTTGRVLWKLTAARTSWSFVSYIIVDFQSLFDIYVASPPVKPPPCAESGQKSRICRVARALLRLVPASGMRFGRRGIPATLSLRYKVPYRCTLTRLRS
jgi:hypothetical protein